MYRWIGCQAQLIPVWLEIRLDPDSEMIYLPFRHTRVLDGLVYKVCRNSSGPVLKSVNLQFNTAGRWDDNMIVPPSDGPMIIWIDWE